MTTDKTPATLAVDVLAVMDDTVEVLLDERSGTTARSLEEARAAVAELIEAADVLHMLGVSKEEFPDWPDGWDWVRINAAVARVKGKSA